ncbi:ribbon-helix-helix domain-containing protein [Candidatus Woesearchaeota archaeon]|nr:ribbon-helix-helix domain-containing protein [Candidatus Woesearchaeota archaeon]
MARKPISATIDEELIKWLDSEIKDKKKYRNKSHLIEIALEKLKEEETKR